MINDALELKKNFRVPIFEDKKFKEYKYFKLGEQVDDVSYSEQCIGSFYHLSHAPGCPDTQFLIQNQDVGILVLF